MSYLKTAPREAGDYRWKEHPSQSEYILVRVRVKRGELLDESSDLPPAEVGGVWEGPLVPQKRTITDPFGIVRMV